MNERKDFCIECRKETEFFWRKKIITKTIKDKEYQFKITTAICSECGKEMSPHGLIDQNIQEIDEQYREAEGLVSIADINNLMNIYDIGKAPLSYMLGFGEITITRYLLGQVPSKEYSDIIRKVLISPAYMKKLLQKNKDKITNTAYERTLKSVNNMEELFSMSDKMQRVIAYLFRRMEEITPLMLQKLLYFSQGIYSATYGTFLFPEDCEAWVHGPVYPKIYKMFKDFKYNPIDDSRFAIFEANHKQLGDKEKQIIDLVINTFGIYGGKTLEKITHNEKPWKEARKGYDDEIPSYVILKKEDIQKYYYELKKNYDICSEIELKKYILDKLN